MNVFLFLLLLVLFSQNNSCEENQDKVATVTAYHNEISKDGYSFFFKTTNGIEQTEKGELVEENGTKIMRVVGSYIYKSSDGSKLYLVSYTADENGYRPKTTVISLIPSEEAKSREAPEPEIDIRIGSNVLGSLIGGNG